MGALYRLMRIRMARSSLLLLTKSKKNFLPLFGCERNRNTPMPQTIGKRLYFGSHRFMGHFDARHFPTAARGNTFGARGTHELMRLID
jgi:hypothetical protein